MGEEQAAPGRTVNLGMALFLTAFAVLYVVLILCVVFISEGSRFEWTTLPSWVLLIVSPVYVRAMWKQHAECVMVDYFAPYVPLVVWFVVAGFFGRGKGPINFFVVEPYIVGVLSGLYLVRFALARAMRGRVNPVVVAAGWTSVVTAVTETTAMMMPDLGR